MAKIYEGTNQIQRMVMARQILRYATDRSGDRRFYRTVRGDWVRPSSALEGQNDRRELAP